MITNPNLQSTTFAMYFFILIHQPVNVKMLFTCINIVINFIANYKDCLDFFKNKMTTLF